MDLFIYGNFSVYKSLEKLYMIILKNIAEKKLKKGIDSFDTIKTYLEFFLNKYFLTFFSDENIKKSA